VLFVQWHFCQKLGKQTKKYFLPKNGFCAITFESETLDSQPKAPKTHIIVLFPTKISIKKLAFAVGAQGLMTMAKYA